VRGLAARTLDAYVRAVVLIVHRTDLHPARMGANDVQSHLASLVETHECAESVYRQHGTLPDADRLPEFSIPGGFPVADWPDLHIPPLFDQPFPEPSRRGGDGEDAGWKPALPAALAEGGMQ